MGSPAQEEPVELTPRARRHRGRRILLGSLAALVVVLLVEAWFLLTVGADLRTGRDELAAAKRHAIAGDLVAARTDLGDATAAFDGAADRADSVLGRVARAIPWAGNGARAAMAMADAGGSLARAGTELVDALGPGGVASLAPADGRLPLERYTAIADAVRRAGATATDAATALDAAPDSLMPSSLASARWDAASQAMRFATDLRGLGLLLDNARDLGGDGDPSRYLVVAQNPAELRGTGGIWGAYAIVTIDDGRVRVSSASPTQTLRDFPAGRVESPNADYERIYEDFGGAGSWQNMNATPDFPAAAQAALANYALGEHERLDGVWAVDPFALQAFLHVTGPTSVPGAGRISEGNVVAFTTNRAYSAFPGAAQRKEVLGAVAADVFVRFLSMDEHAVARLRALSSVIADGHLRIYSADAGLQEALETLGVSGSLAPTTGDLTGVTVNNGSGSKVDYYANRSVRYDVQLGGTGQAISTLTVSIENDAPTTGQPRYVLGPYIDGAAPGDVVALSTVWCHEPCDLVTAERDGTPIELAWGSERGVPWLRDDATIPAGDTGTLTLAWRADGVWSGNSSGGSYDLTFLGQTTVRPTAVEITIHAPAGQRIVWTSEPMDVHGDTATWTGTPSAHVALSVRFRAPLPVRIWRDVTRPVLGLG
jgi:hypothetical protein